MSARRDVRTFRRAFRAMEIRHESTRFLSRASTLVVSEDHVKKEREKARALRASAWWKRRCAEGVCGYCGKVVGTRQLTMDHRVPLIRGGKSTKGNLVPACKSCNNQKKSLLPIEWEEYLRRLAQESRSC